MNRTKYRACLIVVLVIAVVFGVLYYVYGGEEAQEPFAGATLVLREEGTTPWPALEGLNREHEVRG